MTQIITSREAYDKHNDLLHSIVLQLRKYSAGERIDFDEQGFEDMLGNDIFGFDDENVYMDNDFDVENSYPLHELELMDAIKILGDIEAGTIKKA